MGVLCSKPGTDGIASDSRGAAAAGGGGGGFRTELSRPVPKSLIVPPAGTLEVFARSNIDGPALTPSTYQNVWAVLTTISRDGAAPPSLFVGGGGKPPASSFPFTSHDLYLDAMYAWNRTLSDMAGNVPTATAGGGGANHGRRSPANTIDTAVYAAPSAQQKQQQRNGGVVVSFEEIAYKLFSNQTKRGGGDDDDDDDDDGMSGAGFDMQVYQDDDPFNYNNHSAADQSNRHQQQQRPHQLSPTVVGDSNRRGGGGGGGLLHANYNPLLSSSLGSPSGASNHLTQLSVPGSGGVQQQLVRRRSGSSSSSTAFPLNMSTVQLLVRALFPAAPSPSLSTTSENNTKHKVMSGVTAQLPIYLSTTDTILPSSNIKMQQKSARNGVAASELIAGGGVGSRRNSGRNGNTVASGGEPTSYFVSFDVRCALVRSSSRQDYFDVLRKASRAVSIVLHPVALTLSVALGRFTRKKATQSSRMSPGLRCKTSNMSNNNNNSSNNNFEQPEPETLEECVRVTLRNYWRASEGELLQLLQANQDGYVHTTLSDPSSVVRHVVDRGLKLLFLAGGGWSSISADDRRLGSNEDILLAEALQVDAVNSLVGALTRAAGFDGFRGMHSLEDAEQWVLCLREVSVQLGLIPPLSPEDHRDQVEVWWPRFMSKFPLFSLADDGKQTMLYLHAIVMGQQKLALQPIMRADALRSAAKAVNTNEHAIAFSEDATSSSSGLTARNVASMLEDCLQQPPRNTSSFRLFPVLATEGVGLESGEGHGPRKELFDLCSGDVTAPRSLPMDITSAATFQLVSNAREIQSQRLAAGATIGPQFLGKPVLMVAWKQRKLVGTFQQGDVITMTLERRGRAGSVTAAVATSREQFNNNNNSNAAGAAGFDGSSSGSAMGANSSSSLAAGALEGFSPSGNQSECWTVEGALETSNPHESLIVLSSTQARIPLGFRVVSCKVEQKRNPPFRHDVGNTYAWLNPMFLRSAAAAQKKSAATLRASGGNPLATAAVSSTSVALDSISAHAVMFTVGWLLANAVPNGLVLPCTLPPFLFRYARYRILNPHSTYTPHPSDAALVNAALTTSMEDTMRMSDKDFHDLLLAEGLDPSTTTREIFLESTLLEDALWNSGDADASRLAVDHLVLGFASSPLATCPILLQASCSKQARSVLCGAIDEGTSAFSFQEHFRILEDSIELSQFDFSVAFRDLLWDVLENGFTTVEGKRQLLKFITGRTLLPPRKKAEHIKVEFPMAPMNAKEFDKALSRLPSSHSCDNVLEVVNVLECLLFQTESPFYARSGRRPGGVVLDDQKESAWSMFSLEEQRALQRDAKRILRDKLRQAVTLSGTYELDDAAVSRATREAFEAANAGPTPQPAASAASVAGGGYGFDNAGGGGGLAGYNHQSVSFDHNSSSTNSGGTPNSKPAPRYSSSVGAFHQNSSSSTTVGIAQPLFSTSSPPHHHNGGASQSYSASPPPAGGAGTRRSTTTMSSSAAAGLRATTQVEEFDFDDEDLTTAVPQEQKHPASYNSHQPQSYGKGGSGGLAALSTPPAAPYGGGGPQSLSMDSSGVLLTGARNNIPNGGTRVGGIHNNANGAALRGSNGSAGLHHSQHLSMFDKHNHNDDRHVGMGGPSNPSHHSPPVSRRPTATMPIADGFDSDVDVVELEDDLVATSRSSVNVAHRGGAGAAAAASQAQYHQTVVVSPPPPPVQQQRTDDIDDLMTELFPARR